MAIQYSLLLILKNILDITVKYMPQSADISTDTNQKCQSLWKDFISILSQHSADEDCTRPLTMKINTWDHPPIASTPSPLALK